MFTLDVYPHVLSHMQEDAGAKVEAALMGDKAHSRDWNARFAALFPVDPPIKPFNQLRGAYRECIAYAEKSGHGDGTARLNLLPMASRETKSNHIFLGKSLGPAELFHSFSKGSEELFIVDQA